MGHFSDYVDNHGNRFYCTNTKLKICGHIVENYKYAKDFIIGDKPKFYGEKKDKENKTTHTFEEIQAIKASRARRKLIDYVNSNSWMWTSKSGRPYPPVFLTLTFAEDIKDVEMANYEFTKFIQRLNTFFGFKKVAEIKYVGVIEFQDKNRDGVVHYHIIFFNLPYRKNNKAMIENIWTNGFIKLKALYSVKNVGFYLCKYMTKNHYDSRLKNKKTYFTSRGLKKPRVEYIEEMIHELLHMIPSDTLEVERKDVPCGYLAYMDYQRYNLKNYPQKKQDLLDFLDHYYYDEEKGLLFN